MIKMDGPCFSVLPPLHCSMCSFEAEPLSGDLDLTSYFHPQLPCASGLTWLVYSTSGVPLSLMSTSQQFTATGAEFSGKWRVAMLLPRFALPYGWTRASLEASSASFEAQLDRYANVYATGQWWGNHMVHQ